MIQQVEITLKPKSRGFHLVTSEILSQLPKLPKTGVILCLLFMPLVAWAQKQYYLPTAGIAETWSSQMIHWLKAKGFISSILPK